MNAVQKKAAEVLNGLLEHYEAEFSRNGDSDWYVTHGSGHRVYVTLQHRGVTVECTGCKDLDWTMLLNYLEERRPNIEKYQQAVELIDVKRVVAEIENAGELRYPVEVWDGTIYGDYAIEATKGNNIPAEFFIESLKTATGAVVGNGLFCRIKGVTPRFYTILMAPSGGGKGTAIAAARNFYAGFSGVATFSPLLWGGGAEPSFKNIGAATFKFSSDTGMMEAVSQTRWLQLYEEADYFFEKGRIQGSGQSLLSTFRELFDSEMFEVSAKAKRKGGSYKIQNSFLGGTTPDLFGGMFAGTQSEKSGLHQRLNIIAISKDINKVAVIPEPSIRKLQEKLFEKILRLEDNPLEFTFTAEAIQALENWISGEEITANPEESGRLNVIAMRNAMHLAWLHGTEKIGVVEVNGGIALADYLLEVRLQNRPHAGDNVLALIQSKIKAAVRKNGRLMKNRMKKSIHAERYGTRLFKDALGGLLIEGELKYSDSDKHYSLGEDA
jgi:hypothetical protein